MEKALKPVQCFSSQVNLCEGSRACCCITFLSAFLVAPLLLSVTRPERVVSNVSVLPEYLYWDVWVGVRCKKWNWRWKGNSETLASEKQLFLIPVFVQTGRKQLLTCHSKPRKSTTPLPKNVDLGAPGAVL